MVPSICVSTKTPRWKTAKRTTWRLGGNFKLVAFARFGVASVRLGGCLRRPIQCMPCVMVISTTETSEKPSTT